MVYPPSPYSVKADVRKEAGGIYSTVDLPDPEVDAKISAADRLIDDRTDKEETGWLGTENDYPRVKEISKIIAASLSRARFDPTKAKEQYDYGMMLLEGLAGELGDSGLIAQSNEKVTFPSNPKAPWFGGRYNTSGIPEVTVDPDSIYEQS